MSTSTATTGPLRRVPVQGRSVARVQRMLDACAELVDEVGYEGLTTTLLAERAEVAIGSVYQFFPDKRAIVQALTLRTMEAYLQRLDERFAGDDLDALVGRGRRRRSTSTSPCTERSPASVRCTSATWSTCTCSTRSGTTTASSPTSSPGCWSTGSASPTCRSCGSPCEIAVEAADALIKLAFRREPDRRRPGAGRGEGADPGVPAPPGRDPGERRLTRRRRDGRRRQRNALPSPR